MQLTQRLGDSRICHLLQHRPERRTVKTEVDLRDPPRRVEALLVLRAGAAEYGKVGDGSRLEAQDVIAVDQLRARQGFLVTQCGLVEPGGKDIDQVNVGTELPVLLPGHPAGYEDAKVADLLMHGVDDGLVVALQVAVVGIEVGDPGQRLRRRGDVVAARAEDQDR